MKLSELEAVARAATPGPWRLNYAVSHDKKSTYANVTTTRNGKAIAGQKSNRNNGQARQRRANLEHIAAWSPDRALAMLAVVKAAAAWWEEQRPYRESLADHLANPTVNCAGEAEKALALAVAALAAEAIQKGQR